MQEKNIHYTWLLCTCSAMNPEREYVGEMSGKTATEEVGFCTYSSYCLLYKLTNTWYAHCLRT